MVCNAKKCERDKMCWIVGIEISLSRYFEMAEGQSGNGDETLPPKYNRYQFRRLFSSHSFRITCKRCAIEMSGSEFREHQRNVHGVDKKTCIFCEAVKFNKMDYAHCIPCGLNAYGASPFRVNRSHKSSPRKRKQTKLDVLAVELERMKREMKKCSCGVGGRFLKMQECSN